MKNISKWSATKIANWHIKNLSWVTRDEQVLKLIIELNEAKKELGVNYERWIGEWADVWIVAVVLHYRFYLELGWVIMEYIRTKPEYVEIMTAVDKKMEINAKRNWFYHEETKETRHD